MTQSNRVFSPVGGATRSRQHLGIVRLPRVKNPCARGRRIHHSKGTGQLRKIIQFVEQINKKHDLPQIRVPIGEPNVII
jgi:hypothetical protein